MRQWAGCRLCALRSKCSDISVTSYGCHGDRLGWVAGSAGTNTTKARTKRATGNYRISSKQSHRGVKNYSSFDSTNNLEQTAKYIYQLSVSAAQVIALKTKRPSIARIRPLLPHMTNPENCIWFFAELKSGTLKIGLPLRPFKFSQSFGIYLYL